MFCSEESILSNEKTGFVRTPVDGVIIKLNLYSELGYLISDIKLCLEIYAENLVESTLEIAANLESWSE